MHQWHAACLPFLLSALAWSQCSKKITVINEQIWLCLCACVSSLWLINQMTSKKVRGMCVPDPFMGRRGMWVGDRLPRAEITTLRLKYVCQTNFLLCVRAGMCERLYLVMLRGRTKIQKTEATVSDRGGRARKERLVIIKGRTHTHTHTKQSHVSITSENTALTDILEIKSNCIHAIIKAACAIPNVQPDFKLGFYRVYWFMFSRHLAP